MLRSHVQLAQMLLQLQEALMVGVLNEQLISFVVDDHLESRKVKVTVAGG